MKKITKDNIHEIYKEGTNEYKLLNALIYDVIIYNDKFFPDNLEIWYEDVHTEYSPERTDPCPDYFGTFMIKWEGYDDFINNEMTLEDLDCHLCTLCVAFEQLNIMGLIRCRV